MIKTFKKYITGEVLNELLDFNISYDCDLGNVTRESHKKTRTHSNKNVYCCKKDCITTEGDCY